MKVKSVDIIIFCIMLDTFGCWQDKGEVIWQNSCNGPKNTNVSVCIYISCFESMCDNLIHLVKQKKSSILYFYLPVCASKAPSKWPYNLVSFQIFIF